ncbi:MAG: phospholipase D-like domain-containing protein, partial [Terracidiphilus sp.]
LLGSPRKFLLLASPFITRSVAHWIGDHLAKCNVTDSIQLICLTNLRIDSILNGSLELEGLEDLGRTFKNFNPIHLPALHAKVFIADWDFAIITSGNLTHGGLRGNFEYGVAIRNRQLVTQARIDFEKYARLGAPLTLDDIAGLASEVAELRPEFQAIERRALNSAGSRLRKKLRMAEDRVLRFRARRSNHAVFCETIEYLLSTGPLKTAELHPLIQRIHPDLCDDSVDRVIEGVNFGKKWKHLARSAQQALKREGRIEYDGSIWRLTAENRDGQA